MENGDSAHSEHTHRNCNNARYDFVYGTRSLCTLRKEPEEKFPSAFFIPSSQATLTYKPAYSPM